MTFPAREAYETLIAQNVGTQSGAWPIKIGPLTTSPDQVISVIDAPGQAPNPKWLLDFPAIQILVRSGKDDYAGASAKANAVKDALLGINSFTFASGNRWDSVTMLGDVNYLGPDDNARPMFSLNFRLIREPAPTAQNTNREPL